jgi:hypothetical protein
MIYISCISAIVITMFFVDNACFCSSHDTVGDSIKQLFRHHSNNGGKIVNDNNSGGNNNINAYDLIRVILAAKIFCLFYSFNFIPYKMYLIMIVISFSLFTKYRHYQVQRHDTISTITMIIITMITTTMTITIVCILKLSILFSLLIILKNILSIFIISTQAVYVEIFFFFIHYIHTHTQY